MTYYTEIRKNNISFYFNEKKTKWYDPKYCPNDPLRMTGKKDAAKTSVVPLKQRPNAYLPVCQEGLLNGGRRVEPAGPAWRPRDSIAERKFMTDDSVVLLLAVLCWFESNTPKKREIPYTDNRLSVTKRSDYISLQPEPFAHLWGGGWW